jgi:hypothetical protein
MFRTRCGIGIGQLIHRLVNHVGRGREARLEINDLPRSRVIGQMFCPLVLDMASFHLNKSLPGSSLIICSCHHGDFVAKYQISPKGGTTLSHSGHGHQPMRKRSPEQDRLPVSILVPSLYLLSVIILPRNSTVASEFVFLLATHLIRHVRSRDWQDRGFYKLNLHSFLENRLPSSGIRVCCVIYFEYTRTSQKIEPSEPPRLTPGKRTKPLKIMSVQQKRKHTHQSTALKKPKNMKPAEWLMCLAPKPGFLYTPPNTRILSRDTSARMVLCSITYHHRHVPSRSIVSSKTKSPQAQVYEALTKLFKTALRYHDSVRKFHVHDYWGFVASEVPWAKKVPSCVVSELATKVLRARASYRRTEMHILAGRRTRGELITAADEVLRVMDLFERSREEEVAWLWEHFAWEDDEGEDADDEWECGECVRGGETNPRSRDNQGSAPGSAKSRGWTAVNTNWNNSAEKMESSRKKRKP